MMLGFGLGTQPIGVLEPAPPPADVKTALHVIDDRVEAWRQQRAAVDAAFEVAHAALRAAASSISVDAPGAANCREQLPAIKARYVQAVANFHGLAYQLDEIASQMRQLARQVTAAGQ